MKKLIPFLILIVGFYFLNFEKKNKFPSHFPLETIEFFEGEYLSTIRNKSLNTLLENNFPLLFDQVNGVDAQYSKKLGYYYVVFGTQRGEEKIELLKVHKSDIENETYSYIDFSNARVTKADNYCREGMDEPNWKFCHGPCALRDDCIGIICGVGTQCAQP